MLSVAWNLLNKGRIARIRLGGGLWNCEERGGYDLRPQLPQRRFRKTQYQRCKGLKPRTRPYCL